MEQAERLGVENIPDGNSVESLTFRIAFLLGHGNSHMKSTVLNIFPPMLQSYILTIASPAINLGAGVRTKLHKAV